MKYTEFSKSMLDEIGDRFILLTNTEEKTAPYSDLRSRADFSLLEHIILYEGEYPFSFLEDKIIFCNQLENGDGYCVYDFEKKMLERFTGNQVLFYIWASTICYYDKESNLCKCFQGDKEVYSFSVSLKLIYIWSEAGIIERTISNEKNGWIRCINPSNGSELWKYSFQGSISDAQQYKKFIILRYYAPFANDNNQSDSNKFTEEIGYSVVIDSFTGLEIWRSNIVWQAVCPNQDTLLAGKQGGQHILELDIYTGNLIYEIEIIPYNSWGYQFSFADATGVYYIDRYGGFGKIRKSDGVVEWEYVFIDNEGQQHQVTPSWRLLGNGKLLLNTINENGKGLLCLFDPDENLVDAKILNGIIKEPSS